MKPVWWRSYDGDKMDRSAPHEGWKTRDTTQHSALGGTGLSKNKASKVLQGKLQGFFEKKVRLFIDLA